MTNAERAGWWSMQLNFVWNLLMVKGSNKQGFVKDFMSGLKPEIAKELPAACDFNPEIQKAAIQAWKEISHA